MDKENKNLLVKKSDVIVKFYPQKKKGLIVRGLKESISKKTVLLVDDDLHIHKLIREEIRNSSLSDKVRTVHFYSPLTAFDYLISNNVHLVISCILFPDVDGLKFLRAFKPLYLRVPFIFHTSYDYKDDFATWAAEAYVVKSVDLSELFNVIESLLDTKHSTEEYNCKIKANDIDALLSLATSYNCLSERERAIEILTEIIRRDPNNASAYSLIGKCYFHLGEHEDAIKYLKHAVKLTPDDLEVNKFLGFAYGWLKQYLKATEAFRKVINLEPQDAVAHYWLGGCYTKLSQKNMAVAEYQILKKLDSKLAEKLFEEIYK